MALQEIWKFMTAVTASKLDVQDCIHFEFFQPHRRSPHSSGVERDTSNVEVIGSNPLEGIWTASSRCQCSSFWHFSFVMEGEDA